MIKTKKYIGGLFQAEVGDTIEIGIQGSRFKHRSKIVKIVTHNRLQDEWGHIFNRDGQIFRRKGHPFYVTDKKIKISAGLIIQEKFDAEYKRIKMDFLRTFDYSKLDIEEILTIIDAIPRHEQGNTLQNSRFKK
jgi:hypothetical protein